MLSIFLGGRCYCTRVYCPAQFNVRHSLQFKQINNVDDDDGKKWLTACRHSVIDVIQLKALSVILKYHTTGHFLFMILVTKSLSPAIFEIMGIKHRGPWPWSFEVRRRHRSRDHSARYWPFPIGNPFGTKSLSLTVSKMFCLKLHVLIDTMLNRHCACAISRNMYPYAKFNYIISISYPHFVYSLPPLCLFTVSLSLGSHEE